jgi:cytochrome c551
MKTLVKVAEAVTAAACLAFVVLLFFQADDPTEVQAGPAAAFPDEAAAAIDACQKARTEGNPAARCPEPAGQAGGEGGATTTAPEGQTTTTEAQNEADGQAIFAASCATCHGGDGGGGIGPNIQDVSNREAVITQVTNGGGGMPSFEGRLSSAEIEAVADYVVNEL